MSRRKGFPSRGKTLPRQIHGHEVVAAVMGLGGDIEEEVLGEGLSAADHDQGLHRFCADSRLAEETRENRSFEGNLEVFHGRIEELSGFLQETRLFRAVSLSRGSAGSIPSKLMR